jgi:hypothetical protein
MTMSINTILDNTMSFNTNLDELPFDILGLIFSLVLSFSSFPTSETRNLSMVSKKMNSTITQCRLSRWDEEQDREKLLTLVQKLLAMPVRKAERIFDKFHSHFPFSRFSSFVNLIKYALLNISHETYTNVWVEYLIDKQSPITPTFAKDRKSVV